MRHVTSKDGTFTAYKRSGRGPALVVVGAPYMLEGSLPPVPQN